MEESQLQQVCFAIEASGSDGECVVLAGPREGEVVLSEASTALLARESVDAETARRQLVEAPPESGAARFRSRRVGSDFPQRGWGAYLITREPDATDAPREEGHDLSKVRHDLRGVANNIFLSIELAYRKAKAIPGAETVVVALAKSREHARTFVAQIEELRDD